MTPELFYADLSGRLLFLGFRKPHLKNSILVGRARLSWVNHMWKVQFLVVLSLFRIDSYLQHSIRCLQLHILLLDAGNLNHHDYLVALLHHIHKRLSFLFQEWTARALFQISELSDHGLAIGSDRH